MITFENINDAQYCGLVGLSGDAASRYMVEHSRNVKERVVKFGDVSEDYSLRVFLMPREVPPNTDTKLRCKVRAHPKLDNVDYYPYILYKIRGDAKRIIHPDQKGYFTLPYPKDRFVEEEGREPEYYFKIDDSVFNHAETLKIDEPFLMRYLKNDEEGFSLLLQIRKAFLYYADIEEWTATMLSLWTMATFVYQAFSAFPYVYLLAERMSGKTRVLKIISHLSNNGVFLVSPRLPTVYRLGDSLSPTFVFDEMEFLTKAGSREDENQEFLNVLNSGYERGAKVFRTNAEKGMTQESFDSYCPKAIASTEEISGILSTRSLRGPIKRTKNLDFVTRDPMEDIPSLKTIQEQILFWAIGNASEIANRNRNDVLQKYREKFTDAPVRTLQIMLPLLTVYEHLKETAVLPRDGENTIEAMDKQLLEIIAYQSAETKSVSTDDSNVRILLALKKCIKGREKTKPWPGVMNKEVRERIEEELDREEDIKFFSPKKIGKVLSKFNIEKREMDGKPQYFGGPSWTYESASAVMDDLLARYNIETAEAVEARDEEERQAQKEETK